MSVVVVFSCDYCHDEEHGYDEVDTLPRYWGEGVDINGDFYEHLCESCYADIIICDWCSTGFMLDNQGMYCEALDEYYCGECDGIVERHQQEYDSIDWGEEDAEECICGYEPDHILFPKKGGPWLKTIPA